MDSHDKRFCLTFDNKLFNKAVETIQLMLKKIEIST